LLAYIAGRKAYDWRAYLSLNFNDVFHERATQKIEKGSPGVVLDFCEIKMMR
jgi:hypothetical protein